MKKRKLILILLSLVGVLAVILVGCNQQQPPATPQQAADQVTQAVKVAYVGNDTCLGCHSNKSTNVPHTQHFTEFKPLSAYPTTQALGQITVFDAVNTDKPTSATIDLSKDTVYGVMVDDYIIAQAPTGFKDKYYRVAALKSPEINGISNQPVRRISIRMENRIGWLNPLKVA